MKQITKRIYFGIIGVLAVIVNVAWKDLVEYFKPDDSIYNIRFLWLCIVLTAVCVFLIMYLFLELQVARAETLQLKYDNVARELHDSEKKAFLDTLTGVPNQLMFEKDLEKLKSSVSEQNPVHIILIDIDGFGEINNKFRYSKGNDVLRFMAQLIYNSMRRDEEMYTKKDLNKYGKIQKIRDQLFRLHRAGDEFLFVINGELKAALGFATRLKQSLSRESQRVADILEIKRPKHGLRPGFTITFHAAIIPLLKNHTLSVIKQWLDDYFIKAKNHEFRSCISWPDRLPDKYYLDENPESLFSKAIDAFKVPKNI